MNTKIFGMFFAAGAMLLSACNQPHDYHDTSGYDRTCAFAADCSAVYEGGLCGPCFVANSAVNSASAAAYQHDLDEARENAICALERLTCRRDNLPDDQDSLEQQEANCIEASCARQESEIACIDQLCVLLVDAELVE